METCTRLGLLAITGSLRSLPMGVRLASLPPRRGLYRRTL